MKFIDSMDEQWQLVNVINELADVIEDCMKVIRETSAIHGPFAKKLDKHIKTLRGIVDSYWVE